MRTTPLFNLIDNYSQFLGRAEEPALLVFFARPPPRWGGMVLAATRKTRGKKLPLGA